MTKKDFIARYYKNSGINSKVNAERRLNDIIELINDSLIEGEEVNFIGWGKWENVERKPRVVRNPLTNKKMTIPGKRAVIFKAGKKLRESIG